MLALMGTPWPHHLSGYRILDSGYRILKYKIMDSLVVKGNISVISFLLRPQTVLSLGNSVVILNKSDYLKRMKEILSDIDKF